MQCFLKGKYWKCANLKLTYILLKFRSNHGHYLELRPKYLGMAEHFITDIFQNCWYMVIIKSRPTFICFKTLYRQYSPLLPTPREWGGHPTIHDYLVMGQILLQRGCRKRLTWLFNFLIRFFSFLKIEQDTISQSFQISKRERALLSGLSGNASRRRLNLLLSQTPLQGRSGPPPIITV